MNRRRESISRYRQSSPPPPSSLSTSKKRSFLELRQPSSSLYCNNGIILSSSSSNQSSTSSSSANKYRFYRSSSDNVHLDDIYRYRINFDRMLIKINQIKLIVCAGCIFHLVNLFFFYH